MREDENLITTMRCCTATTDRLQKDLKKLDTRLSEEIATRTMPARRCWQCGCDTYVYETRERSDGSIIRRRKCLQCGARQSTIERFRKKIRGTSHSDE